MRRLLAGLRDAFIVALLSVLCSGQTFAADPVNVQVSLQGCKNDGSVTLPVGGKFICPDAMYTGGNLGKFWTELDLVPHRVTLEATNSAPATQTYTIALALDYKHHGIAHYDVISVPVLNSTLSDLSCGTATAQPAGPAGALDIPGLGGIDESIFRLMTVTQSKNTKCVYDFYGRLAIGSHLSQGGSLHANAALSVAGDDDGLAGGGSSGLLVNLTTQGIGAREVSVLAKEIAPQELRKTMEASADSAVQWGLKKSASPASINFGDVCKLPAGEQSKQVTFKVEWEKTATVPGGVTFTTKIYAKNPSTRTITVNVTDTVYKGTTQTSPIATFDCGDVDVESNTEKLVCTHTKTISDGSAGWVGDYLNDVATAAYKDTVTGIAIPATNPPATATAQIQQGVVNDSYAAIADSESMMGTGLQFSVAVPLSGAFSGYTAGTKTTGPVDWGVTGETTSGYVEFVKTIYLDARRVTNGKIYDTAALVADNSAPALPLSAPYAATASAEATITSSVSVELTIEKIIPSIAMTPTQKIEVTFEVTRGNDPGYKIEKTLTFLSGETTQSVKLTGLTPDSYTVTEKSSQFCDGATCGPSGLAPVGSSAKTAVLTAGADDIFQDSECAGTASFTNEPAKVAWPDVKKITDPVITNADPDYLWTFTLKGPGLPAEGVSVKAGANAGAVSFKDVLPEPFKSKGLAEGNYTVTETQRTPVWVLTNAAPDANSDKVCEFTVDYPADFGKTFSCTFNNQKQGKAAIAKTASGQSLDSTAYAFTFELRIGASTAAEGTTLASGTASSANSGAVGFDTWLVPGDTYQLCELVMPGWNTNLSNYGTLFVPNSLIAPSLPNPDADNMVVCVDFTVAAGDTKTFNVDNSPPPGGRALTIGFWKNWASCAKSKGKGHKPVLDQTLATAEPPGIVVSAASGSWKAFGPTYYLVLHGSTATPNAAPDCTNAERLLDKSAIDTDRKKASDPAWNLAAQLVAAELNLVAGAYSNGAVIDAINQAVLLLGKYRFDGAGHDPISKGDQTIMNNLAKVLDDYNNNR